MAVEDMEKEILEKFHGLEDDMHHDPAHLWKHKDEIPALAAEVQTLEEHVLEILKILPALRKHSFAEYEAKCRHLIAYLNHPVPSRRWLDEVKESLDLMIKETNLAITRAKGQILAKKRHVIEPMYRIVKLIAEFYRKHRLYDLGRIEAEGKKRGVYVIKGLWELIERIIIKHSYLAENQSVPVSDSEVNEIMEKLILVLALERCKDQREFVLEWCIRTIPIYQNFTECIPRETGLIDISEADAVSDRLHEFARQALSSIGLQYYPLRCYRDNLESESAHKSMTQMSGAHPDTWGLSDILPGVQHGTIFRILQIVYFKPKGYDKSTKDEGKVGGGSFMYVS